MPPTCSCKFCGRDRWSTPNPLVEKPELGNTIPWRRRDGAQCASCPCVLKSREPYKGMAADEVNQKMQSDPEFKRGFLAAVEEWEATRRHGGRQPRSCHKVDTTVSALQQSSLELRHNLGVFWPFDVYRRVRGADPPAAALKKPVRSTWHP